MPEREQDAPWVTNVVHRMLLLALLSSVMSGALGCSEDASAPSVTLPDPADSHSDNLDGVSVAPLDGIHGPEVNECDPDALRIREARPWTGGGVQVVVELLESGQPAAAPESLSVARLLGDDSLEPVAVGTGRVRHGLTAIVLVPSEESAEHEERVAIAKSLVDAFEAKERVAIVVADATSTLMADLTERRPHLHRGHETGS